VRPPGGAKIAALDGARAFAVLVVVIHHAWLGRCGLFRSDCQPDLTGEPLSVHALGLIFGHGDLGVDIFFVLSGYLIFSVLHRALGRRGHSIRETVGRFLVRRFLRLYPALALMIPLNMAFFALLPGIDAGAGPLLEGCRAHAWTNYLLVNNVTAIGGSVLQLGGASLGCVPWTWSIAIEWQFYLLSPLLIWLYVRTHARAREQGRRLAWWRGSALAVILFVLSFGAGATAVFALDLGAPGLSDLKMSHYMAWMYANPLTRCSAYLIGMAAAAYRTHCDASATPPRAEDGLGNRSQSAGVPAPWWHTCAVITSVSLFLLGVVPYFPWRTLNLSVSLLGRTLFSAAVALILVGGAAPEAPRSRLTRILKHRIWYPLAQVSYSVYLWQFVGIELARWCFSTLGLLPYHSPAVWMVFALVSIAMSFAIGAASYIFVERPTLNLRPAA